MSSSKRSRKRNLHDPPDPPPFDIELGGMFSKEDDRGARFILLDIIKDCFLHFPLASPKEIRNNFPSANRRIHMMVVEHWARLVSDYNCRIRGALPPGTELRSWESIWFVHTRDDRFIYKKLGSRSFVLFMSDFCLAFDEENHLVFVNCPMLFRSIVQSPEDLSFDELLDDVPAPQVHFIARRLVQLTEMSWQFACLARFEQALPGADRWKAVTDLFKGSSIDLEATSLCQLVGCRVGLIRRRLNENEAVQSIYRVGLDMFRTVFGLSTSDTGIRRPELLESATMFAQDEITDFLIMSIGGVHNLAFIPKNQDFNTFQGRPYANPMEVHHYFMQLGYGRQCPMLCAKELRTCAWRPKRSRCKRLLIHWYRRGEMSVIEA